MERKTVWTIVQIVVAIIIPNLGGIGGGLIVKGSNLDVWYENLNQPSFRPPNWLFGPVWTALYTAMGVASYLVWRDGEGFTGEAQIPLIIYIAQLILNWAWTPLFFGIHDIVGALMDIVALLTTAIICTILFFKINKIASLLFVPYLAWLSFATCLNYALYKLNPEVKNVDS